MRKLLGYSILTSVLLAGLQLAASAAGYPLTESMLAAKSFLIGGITGVLNVTGTNAQATPLLATRPFGSTLNNLQVNPSDSDGIEFTASDANLRIYRRISGNKSIAMGLKNAPGDGVVIADTNNNGGVKHVEERFNLDGSWWIYADYVHRADGTDMTGTLLPRLGVDNQGIATINDLMKLTPRASSPASCDPGWIWTKTDGAMCFCMTPNNPVNFGPAGVC
jgi:hypothetical protein